MTHFIVCYVLLSITVCKQFGAVTGVDHLMEDNDAMAKKVRIDKLLWLQSFDQGYVAELKIKEDINSMSLDVLDNLIQVVYVKLQCSYVYFALVYLHFINIYIYNPKTLLDNELNSIIFVEESATLLALVHVIPDKQWNTVRAVMWLFHTFAEKIAYFLESDHRSNQDTNTVNKSVIWPYKAINNLLKDFTVTMECKAHDQLSGQPDNFDYVKRTRNVFIGNRDSASSEILSNKVRFWIQTQKNKQVGFVSSNSQHFLVGNLLVSIALERFEEVTVTLKNTFGVQLKWQFIMTMLEHYYNQAKSGIIKASMQEYIQAINMFQYQFISVLKAVAMRIAIVHLIQIKRDSSTTTMSDDVLPHYMMGYTKQLKRVAVGLQAFVDCVHLVDDHYLKMVIDWMNILSEHFENYQIDILVTNILKLLKAMSPPNNKFGVHFDLPMMENSEFYNLLSSMHQLNISEHKEKLFVELYVEFVKTIADFKVIHWFMQLSTTDEFRQFEELEKKEQQKWP